MMVLTVGVVGARGREGVGTREGGCAWEGVATHRVGGAGEGAAGVGEGGHRVIVLLLHY